MRKTLLLALLPICFAVFFFTPKVSKAADNMGALYAMVLTNTGTPVPGVSVKMEGSGGSYYYVGLGTIPCSTGAIVYDGPGFGDGYQSSPWYGTTGADGQTGFNGIPPFGNYGASCLCSITVSFTVPNGYYGQGTTATATYSPDNPNPMWRIDNNGWRRVTWKLTPLPPKPVCDFIEVRKDSATGPTLTEGQNIPEGTFTCTNYHTTNSTTTMWETFRNGSSLASYPTDPTGGWTCTQRKVINSTSTSYRYKVTVSNASGSASCSTVTYNMVPAASVANSCPTLSASPTSVRQGDSVKLTWSGGSNVKRIDIKQKPSGSTIASVFYTPGADKISGGNIDVVPSVSTTYILDAEYSNGTPATCSTADVPVTVRPSQSGSDRPVPPN